MLATIANCSPALFTVCVFPPTSYSDDFRTADPDVKERLVKAETTAGICDFSSKHAFAHCSSACLSSSRTFSSPMMSHS